MYSLCFCQCTKHQILFVSKSWKLILMLVNSLTTTSYRVSHKSGGTDLFYTFLFNHYMPSECLIFLSKAWYHYILSVDYFIVTFMSMVCSLPCCMCLAIRPAVGHKFTGLSQFYRRIALLLTQKDTPKGTGTCPYNSQL